AAVLLDEPLTVVDPALKWTLRSKLKEIHRDTGHTLIYVTHDQTEALTFADEVVVLNDGAIVQAGEPAELFLSPAHEFVGHFIGSPGMNMLPAEIVGDVVRVGQAEVGAVADLPPGPVRIGVRPEFVRITGHNTFPGVPAKVTGIDRMGAYDLVHTRVGEHPVIAKTEAGSSYRLDEVEFLHFPADRTFLFRDEVRCGSLAPLNERGQA
ncbi:ABC transporter ATP-binding protein, partial [Nonomuraea sp. NPDC050643]|uniref:ABC transporter ATP-binding protein n=1 Tax=Nonomuraea sp. NPDC050643 TaxID=3155660 RepID=UPI0033DBA746